MLILIEENQKVEGLISSIKYESSATVGKNPIQFEGTERGRGERRRRQKLRYQTQTPFL